MTVRWIPTTQAVYSAIRDAHHAAMTVHGTITDMGDYNGSDRVMTEWGLPGADFPLVKFDRRGAETSFWIAVVTGEAPHG